MTLFLVKSGYLRGKIDSTMFIKKNKKNVILVQIYVDDIIFGSTNEAMCKEYADLMIKGYEMSMMGELTYFLGLQIKQSKTGIFISKENMLKIF